MRKTRWKTRISDTHKDAISIRGYSLAELIGHISFAEMFYLLQLGELPEPNQARLLEAMLVACADHGIITTSVAARYAIASGTPLQGALAAGVLMIGDVYGGAVEQAARFFHEQVSANSDQEPDRLAAALVTGMAKGERVPGFGHPLHPDGDPRSIRLLALANELGVAGKATLLAAALETALQRHTGRFVPLNADGALGALAIDLGFDWRVTRSLMLLSRTAGVLAHAGEELLDGTRWRLPPPAEHEVPLHAEYYEGRAHRPLPDRLQESGDGA